MAVKMIVMLTMLLSTPSLATIMATSPEPMGEDSHVVAGTLAELDLSTMSGKIKTDMKQAVAFTMTRPNLFKGLSVGERIAARLNGQEQVIKVMETTVPELPSPEK